MNLFILPILAFELMLMDPIFVDFEEDPTGLILEYDVEVGFELNNTIGFVLKTDSRMYMEADSTIAMFYPAAEKYQAEIYVRHKGFKLGTGFYGHIPDGGELWDMTDDGAYFYLGYDSRMARAWKETKR